MAKKIVQCPECNGSGQIRHRDSVREIFYGDRRPIYKQCVRCQGRGWIYKASYLEDRIWELFRW
jgi:DnaJ-class molecular chaperone